MTILAIRDGRGATRDLFRIANGRDGLVEKVGGRVLQTDSGLQKAPVGTGASGWQAFRKRVSETPNYFDLVIEA